VDPAVLAQSFQLSSFSAVAFQWHGTGQIGAGDKMLGK
jgi:hypothetical protein